MPSSSLVARRRAEQTCVRIDIHQRDAILLPRFEVALVAGEARVLVGINVVEDLARELDVVVGKLADLSVVDAQDLGLLGGAQAQARDEVHDAQDDTGAHEGVEPAAEGVGQLVAHLDPVAVEPAAADHLNVVEMGDVVGCEEGRADVAHEAADAVHCKDVERVIDPQQELELGRVVGEASAQDAVDHGGPYGDVTWRRTWSERSQLAERRLKKRFLPDPGVIATSPATTPLQKPTVDHLRSSR